MRASFNKICEIDSQKKMIEYNFLQSVEIIKSQIYILDICKNITIIKTMVFPTLGQRSSQI